LWGYDVPVVLNNIIIITMMKHWRSLLLKVSNYPYTYILYSDCRLGLWGLAHWLKFVNCFSDTHKQFKTWNSDIWMLPWPENCQNNLISILFGTLNSCMEQIFFKKVTLTHYNYYVLLLSDFLKTFLDGFGFQVSLIFHWFHSKLRNYIHNIYVC